MSGAKVPLTGHWNTADTCLKVEFKGEMFLWACEQSRIPMGIPRRKHEEEDWKRQKGMRGKVREVKEKKT